MLPLPAWDSIDGVTRINFWCHIAALAFVFFLALSEILAFVYGERKETLIEASDHTTAIQRQQETDAADSRHAAEIGGLKSQLTEAEKKVENLQKNQPQRRLTQMQKTALIAVMKGFPGQKITVGCIAGDIYGKEVAEDFVEVARGAGWDIGGGSGFTQTLFSQDPVGIRVFVNEAEGKAGRFPVAMQAMVATMAQLGLVPNLGIGADAVLPIGTIRLEVGKKP